MSVSAPGGSGSGSPGTVLPNVEDHEVESTGDGSGIAGEPVLIADATPQFSMPYSMPQAPVMTPGGYSGGGSGSTPSSSETPSSAPTADPFGVESTGSGSAGSSSTSGTGTTGSGSASGTGTSGGTHVFNNLTGRDPDLLYAGETIKIEVNGKTINHVVKPGETLSSIAAANGVSVAALIKTNGMDNNLLGKNSAGDYYTSGGPQPAPGGHANPPPEQSVAPLPTSAELEALRSNVQQLDGHGLEPGEAAEMLKLIDKAISDPKQLTSADIKKLGEYEKTVKAKMKENEEYRAAFNPPTA
jgi:LysM repeat protein